MARVEALIRPELLVWARKSMSLSEEEAARRLKLPLQRLLDWEVGRTRPSVPQLRKMAGLYKRPLAVFYLPAPPKDFDAMKSFRRHPNREFAPPSLELAYQVREAEMHREVLLKLAVSAGEELRQFDLKAARDESAKSLAGRVRARLGITIDRQSKWSTTTTLSMGGVAPSESLGLWCSRSPACAWRRCGRFASHILNSPSSR
jgi:transcriptional regulator with XRE-family HTH domain